MSGTRADTRKRLEEAAAKDEWRREVLQHALAEVWSGADFTDTDAVLDHLRDADATVAPT